MTMCHCSSLIDLHCALQNITLDQFGAKNAHLKGIHYLRDVADADALVKYFPEAKKTSNKAIVVGGGYIGLEVSANLVGNGFDGMLHFVSAAVWPPVRSCMS